MVITERQEMLLDELIKEYINSAKPVSSSFLKKRIGFDICPATIRNEMQKLTEAGYLEQPHTSAGRVPTNKAYRFFVEQLEEPEDISLEERRKIIKKELENSFKLMEFITKRLASDCCGLAFSYISEKDFLLEEGWKEVFKNPEFEEKGFLSEFTNSVDRFEKKIKDFLKEGRSEIQVYIGKEKSILDSSDLSLIVSKVRFPKNQHGILALLGPNRMTYDRNIRFLDSLIKELENF